MYTSTGKAHIMLLLPIIFLTVIKETFCPFFHYPQFDPCLHTLDQIELNAAPMPDRPMLADPDSRRMKQVGR